MDDNDYGSLQFVQSSVENQDIKAEAVLRELETGKKISLRVIRSEMANDRMLYYGTYHRELDTALPPWGEDTSKIPQPVMERLIDWTLDQSGEIQDMVFDFLDAPSIVEKEEKLGTLLEKLDLSYGGDDPPKDRGRTKARGKTMAAIMKDSLPASKDELIRLIQSISVTTRRPAATVRQWLREKTKSGVIYLGNDDKYYLVD